VNPRQKPKQKKDEEDDNLPKQESEERKTSQEQGFKRKKKSERFDRPLDFLCKEKTPALKISWKAFQNLKKNT